MVVNGDQHAIVSSSLAFNVEDCFLPFNISSMEGIRVISTNTIQAENQLNNGDKIHLTGWDVKFLGVYIVSTRGLLFHKPKDSSINQTIQHLKHSLSSTLTFFPPLAGRLVILEHQDNTASSYISCNNAGALFVHAVADNTHVADILRPKYVPPIVKSFFSLNGVYDHHETPNPLLAVQVTELVDGIFIGCTINHAVVDGKSFWHFINSWAQISRGCLHQVSKPSFQRWFPDDIEPPIRFPFPKEEKNQQHVQRPQNSNTKPPPQYSYRIFHFTKEKIAGLKSKANQEVGTDKISSLQAFLTHLWCSVNRYSFSGDPEEVFSYILPIDVRLRMDPPLPGNYFGNAVMNGFASMKAGELLEGGIGKYALEMNRLIASYTGEKVRRHYESCLRAPTPPLQPGGGGANDGMVMLTGSSPRFDVYGNDFGWAKPVAVRNGGYFVGGATTVTSGGAVILFSGAEEGSVDIELFLPYEILEALGNDPDFM